MRGVQSRQGQDCARERVGLAVNVVTAFHRALPVTMRSAPATPPSLPMAADASALKLHAWNHIYNVGSGKISTINDILDAFSKAGALLPRIEYIEEKQFDVKQISLDCSLIQNIVPYNCISLNEGIKRFYTEYITRQNLL